MLLLLQRLRRPQLLREEVRVVDAAAAPPVGREGDAEPRVADVGLLRQLEQVRDVAVSLSEKLQHLGVLDPPRHLAAVPAHVQHQEVEQVDHLPRLVCLGGGMAEACVNEFTRKLQFRGSQNSVLGCLI